MAEFVRIGSAPSREMYERASAEIGEKAPAGLIIHTATEVDDGTVRIVDVWESREAAEAFDTDVLGPIVAGFRAELGDDAPAGPSMETYEPFDVIRG